MGRSWAQARLQVLSAFSGEAWRVSPALPVADGGQAGPSLPVEGGTAHRVDGAAMGREGELGRGPQGHGAGHPREGGLFRCQRTLEWEAAFRAQNEKAGVKAGESHRRGAHLGLPPVRLWRNGQQGRAKGIWSVSQRSPGTQVDATAQRGRGPARLGRSHRPEPPRGPPPGQRPRPPRTFFSLVFRGSCCTTRAKPSVSCSWPAPAPCHSSTFPSVATLSTRKRWLWRGSGSQTTWDRTTECGDEVERGMLDPAHPPTPSKMSFSTPLPFPSRKKRFRGEAWEPPHPPGAGVEGPSPSPSPSRKPGQLGGPRCSLGRGVWEWLRALGVAGL